MFTYYVTGYDNRTSVSHLDTESFREAMLKVSELKKTVPLWKRIQVTRNHYEDVYDTDQE